MAVLRQTSPKPAFQAFWGAVMGASGPGHLPCPSCDRAMQAVQAETEGETISIDRCALCLIVWFDADERARLLGKARDQQAAQAEAQAAHMAALPPQARGAIAGLEATTRVRANERAALQMSLDRLNQPVEPRWYRGRGQLHGALWILEAFGVPEP